MPSPVYYDNKETWKEEFKVRKGHRIHLRNGTEIRPGTRYQDPSYHAAIGKTRDHATASWFMLPGLDSIERVTPQERNPNVVIVADRHGNRAAYDRVERLAADDTEDGAAGKTAAQMGAVMAGEALDIEHPGVGLAASPTVAPLAGQYLEHYRTAIETRDLPNLVRCTDSFMLYAKETGLDVGFADPGLRNLLVVPGGHDAPAAPDDPRARLALGLLSEGPNLIGEILAASKKFGGGPPEDLARSLLSRARGLARDLETYEALVSEDLLRTRANLDLARRALAVLLGAGGPDGLPPVRHPTDGDAPSPGPPAPPATERTRT